MSKIYDMHYYKPPRFIVEVKEQNVTATRAHEVAEKNNVHSYRLTPTDEQRPGELFYILKDSNETNQRGHRHKTTIFAEWAYETYHFAKIFPDEGSDLFKKFKKRYKKKLKGS